jgi:hypothetical protein
VQNISFEEIYMGARVGVVLKKIGRSVPVKRVVKKQSSGRFNRSTGVVKKVMKFAGKATLSLGRLATIALVGRW